MKLRKTQNSCSTRSFQHMKKLQKNWKMKLTRMKKITTELTKYGKELHKEIDNVVNKMTKELSL